MAEYGRIDKTLHTLNYIDDEANRRATLNQLNRGEAVSPGLSSTASAANCDSITAKGRKISSEHSASY